MLTKRKLASAEVQPTTQHTSRSPSLQQYILAGNDTSLNRQACVAARIVLNSSYGFYDSDAALPSSPAIAALAVSNLPACLFFNTFSMNASPAL
jgi:hypothetical protein